MLRRWGKKESPLHCQRASAGPEIRPIKPSHLMVIFKRVKNTKKNTKNTKKKHKKFKNKKYTKYTKIPKNGFGKQQGDKYSGLVSSNIKGFISVYSSLFRIFQDFSKEIVWTQVSPLVQGKARCKKVQGCFLDKGVPWTQIPL